MTAARCGSTSETEHPDLFWAARGAGANFGVATRFELRLHPIGPTMLGGILMYPAPTAAALLRNFRNTLTDAPDEVGAGVALFTAPHHDFVPEPVRGQPVVGVVLCYAGPVQEGEDALRPLRDFGPPAVDLIEPMPYVAVQQLLDADYPSGMRNYWTGEFLTGLPDEAIEVMVRVPRVQAVAAGLVLRARGRWRRRPRAGRRDAAGPARSAV